MNLTEYFVLTANPEFHNIVDWLDRHGQWYEVHLNRTRFKLEPGRIATEFWLRYSNEVQPVEEHEYITPEEC